MSSRRGFSLIEMGIVMLIAAIIISIILSVNSLQRASKIQTMLGEYDTYIKAIGEFQDKYKALPGDMNGASGYDPVSLWGGAVVDGDGSGTIGSSTPATGGVGTNGEWFQAWLQLSDAGFIKGSFTGTLATPAGSYAVPGINVPASALTHAGWTLLYFLFPASGAGENANLLWRDNGYGHILTLGAANASTIYTSGAVLNSAEALAVDSKIDDGAPGTGRIRAWRATALPKCTNNDTSQTAQSYLTSTTDNTPTCSLVFLLGF